MSDAIDAVPDGMRLSDWIDNRPVVKATAYALMKALGIEPAKVRQAGISRPVSWLDAEMVTAMDAAVERLQAGATVAEIASSADGQGRPRPTGSLAADDHGRSQPMATDAMLSALLQARQGTSTASPLARARALREAAAEGLLLTTGELADLTGRPAEVIERLRSGSRLQGYRVWKLPGTSADPEPVWRLSEAEWARGVVERLQGRD